MSAYFVTQCRNIKNQMVQTQGFSKEMKLCYSSIKKRFYALQKMFQKYDLTVVLKSSIKSVLKKSSFRLGIWYMN